MRARGVLAGALLGALLHASNAVPQPAEPAAAAAAVPATGRLVRLDPKFDALVPPGSIVERIGTGFGFAEGPLWLHDGTLAFSDVGANAILKLALDGSVTVFRRPSGYRGPARPLGSRIGSNGLTLDAEGRLLICEQGDRRISRLEPDGGLSVLADRFEGMRLNSPNDLVVKSDGSIYFTDPPVGLPKGRADPAKELPFSGVFRIADGKTDLLTRDLPAPNGLAFSPDERFLYVANSGPQRRWLKFPVKPDGTLGPGALFYDVSADPGKGVPDGMKVDRAGNLFATGPSGVYVLAPDGRLLGRIELPEEPSNVAWGNDGKNLYVTAQTSVYRILLNTSGKLP
jgi:gluconolactonase